MGGDIGRGKMALVVKRKGHREAFDERKVYGSVYAACASAHYDEAGCEKVAYQITEKIKKFVKNKKEIPSAALREKVESELDKKDEELAFFYRHHLPNLKRL